MPPLRGNRFLTGAALSRKRKGRAERQALSLALRGRDSLRALRFPAPPIGSSPGGTTHHRATTAEKCHPSGVR